VVEAYDLLRLPEVGDKVLVKGTVTISIQHCLLVRQGVKLEQIGRILSHEQVCQKPSDPNRAIEVAMACRHWVNAACSSRSIFHMPFWRRHHPRQLQRRLYPWVATMKPVLLQSAPKFVRRCLKALKWHAKEYKMRIVGIHLQIHSELADAHIDDDNAPPPVNMTRFYILATARFLVPPPLCGGPKRALVRTGWKPTNTSAGERDVESARNVARLLVTLGLLCTRVDRRPSLAQAPFHDVYFVELQDDAASDSQDWESRIEEAIRRVKGINGDICLLGIW
jgi:prephenate dehydratase